MKKFNPAWIIAITFIVVSCIFEYTGYYAHKSTNQLLSSVKKTTATITNIDNGLDVNGNNKYYISINYEVYSEEYSAIINNYTEGMKENDSVDIYYDSVNPKLITTAVENTDGYLICIIGIIPFLIGICIILYILKGRSNSTDKLKNKGIRLYGIINSVSIDTTNIKDGIYPFYVKVLYKNIEENKEYSIISELIWLDVEKAIKDYNITTLPVYVDPNKYSKAYVDVTPLYKYKDAVGVRRKDI